MLPSHGTRDRLQAGLLPAATCLSVAENFVSADYTRIVELQRLAIYRGPEHEGRVAKRSPGNRDRSVRRLVLNQPVLRENRRRIRFGRFANHDADHTIVVMQEACRSRRNERWIMHGEV